ncbi:MAG: hypothetical protein H0Z33_02100 [Bacillaceae bacterium]|nr:hypothetical protein [Bacillaceae bacterium]
MKKFLRVGGLSLILLGSILGGIYAGMYLPGVKAEQEKSIKSAVEIASESPSYSKQAAEKFVQNKFLDTRTSNFHSHMTLIGVTALVLSFFAPQLNLPDWSRIMAATFLILSGVILPLGIFIENWFLRAGSIIALSGGSMLITSLIIFLFGAFRTPQTD